MRVLMIHNYYQRPGGEDQSFEAELATLRENGHTVHAWTVHNDRITNMSAVLTARKTIWNHQSVAEMEDRLKHDGPYDVVHFQNTFPLISPSAIWTAGQSPSAVVQSLRNYRSLCVNGLFHREGKVCELCINRRFQAPGVLYACYRGNRAASTVVATMNFMNQMRRKRHDAVDAYIALSQFSRDKYLEAGYRADTLHVKPNFVTPDPGPGEGKGGYAVYVGRLSNEKGLTTLLDAWRTLGKRLPLKIVGDGPLSDAVNSAVSASNGTITWLGHMPKRQVYDLVGEATLLVFPSEWYETFGRVAVEAFAKGTPVVAAGIGAIAELVEDDRTGAVFEPGNPEDLVAKTNYILNSGRGHLWRLEARKEYEERYTAERNYGLLLNIYEAAIEHKAKRINRAR